MERERDPLELEFRDGWRFVPEHLVNELRLLETHTMTYEQAVAAADAARLNRWLGDQQHRIIAGHMHELGRGF